MKSLFEKTPVLQLTFNNNQLLPLLFGQYDEYIKKIEHLLGIVIAFRGNEVAIYGDLQKAREAERVLQKLYKKLEQGYVIDMVDIETVLKTSGNEQEDLKNEMLSIKTRKRIIQPRTAGQATFIEQMKNKEMIFSIGPAGTGKTYLAVALGVSMMLEGQIDRMILSRPAVEAGERLGFLPGDLKEKVDPYLRPLYDALHDMLPSEIVMKKLASGEIEVAPLGFMRGRTLSGAFVILDEAQNTTPMQMKMFLTRLGPNSRMVITGDITQIDLPHGAKSGLIEALDILTGVDGIGVVYLTDEDVVRNPLVTRIVQAYQNAVKLAPPQPLQQTHNHSHSSVEKPKEFS